MSAESPRSSRIPTSVTRIVARILSCTASVHPRDVGVTELSGTLSLRHESPTPTRCTRRTCGPTTTTWHAWCASRIPHPRSRLLLVLPLVATFLSFDQRRPRRGCECVGSSIEAHGPDATISAQHTAFAPPGGLNRGRMWCRAKLNWVGRKRRRWAGPTQTRLLD